MSHCDSLEIVKNFFQVFKLDIIYIFYSPIVLVNKMDIYHTFSNPFITIITPCQILGVSEDGTSGQFPSQSCRPAG